MRRPQYRPHEAITHSKGPSHLDILDIKLRLLVLFMDGVRPISELKIMIFFHRAKSSDADISCLSWQVCQSRFPVFKYCLKHFHIAEITLFFSLRVNFKNELEGAQVPSTTRSWHLCPCTNPDASFVQPGMTYHPPFSHLFSIGSMIVQDLGQTNKFMSADLWDYMTPFYARPIQRSVFPI